MIDVGEGNRLPDFGGLVEGVASVGGLALEFVIGGITLSEKLLEAVELGDVVDEVCKKRLCVRCIANVDPCVFQDEDFIAALCPAVVDDEEEDDDVKDEGECEFDRCDANGSYASLGLTVACSESESGGCPDDVSAELCLGNVLEPSMALQTLDRLSQLHPSQLSLSNSQSSLQQSRLTQSQLCHLQTLFQQCRLTQSHLSQSQCQVDHSQSRLRQAQFDESIVAQLRADVEDLKRTVRTTLRSTRAGGGALRGPTTRKFSTTSLERDYQLEFDCSWTMSPAHPLPPKPLKPSVSAQLHTVEAQAAAQESKSKEPLEDVDAPTKNMRHFC
ncbi:hypothetical protein PF002_g21671 [Phytophthora fragariae]|uniref:Uncharacterized protein n=1 Tax=Phytophthora fragariae TaxID=53985 RepID=A0A6A3XDY3_9STRA|nr:hypothetical protein PF002_g21671 [Phytophthora fragariae]